MPLIRFTCPRCKYATEHEFTLAVVNDIGECPMCGAPALPEWFKTNPT